MQSHISLTEPAASGPDGQTPRVLAGLTRREDEVLRHLVAGRTYAEIARALFISEKTVSVHVSNLLRKTGTSSRIEVADLARRVMPGEWDGG
ncbi:MAG TPA: LuxR C-terminal-related transcriptional regulator [Intrasporangium sp.]|uniref:response regulator transcription factor n=1 Tax=Intrasporangium sp. TaxID=1925024 RepID=UPI002B484125|nr:LuxR C-terminal-related transcriptional regulator [Intrasporangium sp.]HKX67611.1 LuxR C-terminal-related transcriptional regulator [Intrasporangium sp.]